MTSDTDGDARRKRTDPAEVETNGSGNGASRPGKPSAQGNTLVIAPEVSLTLWNDSLLVVDKRAPSKPNRTCCGLRRTATTLNHAIPFFNVLDADLSAYQLKITYAQPISSYDVAVSTLSYPIDEEDKSAVQIWVSDLLHLAYGKAQRRKRLKVLINPFGGTGAASGLYTRHAEPIFLAAGCTVDVEVTAHRGHATEIAANIDVDAYDAIACCSGDGLPYEVFNGLAKKRNAREALAKLAVAMIPAGSGNALAWNCYGTGSVSVAALTIVKGLPIPIDLVSITQGNTRTLSFLSQSFGIVAESDLGTDHLRWMGAHRFTWGFLVRLLRKTVWPCELVAKVELDDKQAIKDHYRSYAGREPSSSSSTTTTSQRKTTSEGVPSDLGLPPLKYGTVLDEVPSDWETIPGEAMGNFYAGNMPIMTKDTPFFPAALPADGMIDLVTIDGTISLSKSLQMMDELPKGRFFDMPDVNVRKVKAYRLSPRDKEGYLSIDGESVPFEAFQAEIHQGLGTVLSKSGHLFETDGPR